MLQCEERSLHVSIILETNVELLSVGFESLCIYNVRTLYGLSKFYRIIKNCLNIYLPSCVVRFLSLIQ